MSKEYYFISDLHLTGGQLFSKCEFEQEFIKFLKKLENKDKNTELIIVGDTFGFWEMTDLENIDKLKNIIKNYKRIFDQLKKTGKNIKITIIPGNHDHELACYPEFSKTLKSYNINFEPNQTTTRPIGKKIIWIEHGSQYDNFNYIADYGNPHSTPIGYYLTNKILSHTNKHSDFGKGKWLKDIESVYPNEHIPSWIFSNYYYKEMNPWLRYAILPFMILFSTSFFILIWLALEQIGILKTHIFNLDLNKYLWFFGSILEIIFAINMTIITILLLVSIPIYFFYKDIKKTFKRYGISNTENLKNQKAKRYVIAAKEIFNKNPNVAIFIFGHTHHAYLRKLNNNIIINTGSWLKKLTRIPSRFLLLPAVYYPSYNLNYFKIKRIENKISIKYQTIPKTIKPKLTFLEKIVTFKRKINNTVNIPKETILEL